LLPASACSSWLARLAGAETPRLAQVVDLDDVLVALAPLRALLAARLGNALQVVASQCWVRHAAPPHHWHQDGALHVDFADPAASLLPMWTCWIALAACGADAPGLEWVEPSPQRLLRPPELTDGAVRAAFADRAFVTPRMAAGDALMFDGALLHRTQRLPTPSQPRTSIELRFVAGGAPPARLAHEVLQSWPGRSIGNASSARLPPPSAT
jgi:ectoine hydroxylase-related dioxygenase (phytanoyl-CoA dioxygenase family)